MAIRFETLTPEAQRLIAERYPSVFPLPQEDLLEPAPARTRPWSRREALEARRLRLLSRHEFRVLMGLSAPGWRSWLLDTLRLYWLRRARSSPPA